MFKKKKSTADNDDPKLTVILNQLLTCMKEAFQVHITNVSEGFIQGGLNFLFNRINYRPLFSGPRSPWSSEQDVFVLDHELHHQLLQSHVIQGCQCVHLRRLHQRGAEDDAQVLSVH